MRRRRCVKIVATLGPASTDKKVILELFKAGADVFRINMSHTSHEELVELRKTIRGIEEDLRRPIGILVDLQGPKLRIGDFANGGIDLKSGDFFKLDRKQTPGDQNRVQLPHPEIFESVAIGDQLLLDDGKLRLQVSKVPSANFDGIEAKVLVGGHLSSRKGISLPDTLLPVSAMTDKDREDLAFAAELGVDWVALSFVQRAEDVIAAREIVGDRTALMSKIEKPSAIEDLDRVLEFSNGLMVARGDLGVELPVEKVPGLQKKIIRAARAAGKPVVIATQMLESMITSPLPTRAEVNDVATAVFDGADAVMLSAESAVGKYPVEAVKTMDRVAYEVEQDPAYDSLIHAEEAIPRATGADAISAAAHTVANTLNVAVIICYTSTGSTGLRVARERPEQPVLALTPIPDTARRLAIVWGLDCGLTGDPTDLDDMVERACRIAYEMKFAKQGDQVIITAGVPLGTPGSTNMLRVARVGKNGTVLHKGVKA